MMEASGLQPRALRDVLTGRGRPRTTARSALAALVWDADVSPKRYCVGCGERITSGDPRRRYCSPARGQRAKRQRRATNDAMA